MSEGDTEMPIDQTSQFDMKLAGPIEKSMQVQSLTERDTIPSGKRFDGFETWVVDEAKKYRLVGGKLNSDWVDVTGGEGSDSSTFLADSLSDI